MAEISYVHLPKPTDDEASIRQAHGMRELRLLSLQTDSSSFFSRYADEKDQPLQFSVDRLQDPAAEHFVAVVAPHEAQNEEAATARYDAFLVMVKTETPESAPQTFKEYEMAAIYVRQAYRGRGVCTQLIQRALLWVKEDCRQAGYKEAVVYTTATEVNLSAQRLYQKLGFKSVSHDTERNKVGEDVPVVKMMLHLA